jgi:hypothetical protein
MTEKVKKPFYKKWWVWVLAIIVVGALGSNLNEPTEPASTEVTEEKDAAQQAERKKEAEEKDAKEKEEAEKKKAERESTITLFNTATEQVVNNSNGVISNITITDNTSYFSVKIYVDEATWARSNESEKLSFATTIGTSIENALSPNDTFVDIVSATNNDILATQKMFGGWKIKR